MKPAPARGPVARMLAEKRVIVSCGAGGVGKTTVSASLALAAARAGRRVLVVTIDPSKRLAETLGVERNPPHPVELPAERLAAAGITAGRLSAWMLDPKLVSDRVVNDFAKSPEDARRLLDNRMYKNITAMIAGLQEYTAVEALHGFVEDDLYDLVILDTPPSRDALRFLDAPDRVTLFLDRRIFNLFVPGEGSVIRRMATQLVEKVMDVAFGEDTRRDLQQFFDLFGGILDHLNHNQHEMRAFFRRPDIGFLLVTSPAREALAEAEFFAHKTRHELDMHLCGYVLNRSLAAQAGYEMPDPAALPDGADPALRTGLARLAAIGAVERALVDEHVALAEQLDRRAGDGFAWVLPMLGGGASDLDDLVQLADVLVADTRPGGRRAAAAPEEMP